MAESVTPVEVKETAAERAKREREWNKLVEELPELVNPLDLPDDVQVDMLQSATELQDITSGDGEAEDVKASLELVRTISRIMPSLFVDSLEFETWRRKLPVIKRTPTYITIYAKYVAELGESESSANA